MELKNLFVQDVQGNILSMPVASVCTVGTTEPIEGLQDANGDPLDNPFTGTAQGLLTFAAPNGEYDLIVEASARTFTLRLQFSDVTAAGQIATTGGPTVQTALSGLDSGHLDYETPIDGVVSGFDLAHYAGQGGTSPVAGTIHDYTDAPKTLQLDKVGGDQASQNYILGLRRANNFIRRPDKSGNYVGDAGFIEATYDTWTDTATFTGAISGTTLTVSGFSGAALAVGQRITGAGIAEGTAIAAFGTGSGGNGTYTLTVRGASTSQAVASQAMSASTKGSVQAWLVNKTGGHSWPVLPALFSTSKVNGDAQFAFQMLATAETQNLWSLSGYNTAGGSVQQALSIQTTVSSTRVDIIATSAKTSGMRLEALGGGIDLAPLTGRPVTIRNALKLPVYTVATLPAVGSFLPDSLVKVSNGDSGQPCLAVAEGGVWRRIALGAAVSAT